MVLSPYRPPNNPFHCRATRPLGDNGNTDWLHYVTSKCRIPPHSCRGIAQGRQGNKGMGQHTSNSPMRHPGGNHIRWHQHSIIPAAITTPLPQCAQCNCATGGFCPDLCRAQYITPNILLPRPNTGPHIVNPQPRRSHRVVPPTHIFRIGRTHERTVARDSCPCPLDDGTG